MNESTANEVSKRADEIYFAALAIESEEERAAFVEAACSKDEASRRAVEDLFGWQHQADTLFETIGSSAPSVVDLAQTVIDESKSGTEQGAGLPDDAEIGKSVGLYRLIQKIGEGGGGNVYLAEQKVPVHRQVALKIIKRGMDSRGVIARFEAERQALAMMEHPNIAHVFNAGATEDGRPYFVMELVHGIPVTTYCKQRRLDIRERLDLFTQICHAIQHAHQKGIIHRDIKPFNILITQVDGMAVPKVIDFGIAKATGEQLLSDDTFFTAGAQFVGTPAYMSPEQVDLAEMDIDARSDIYSLGVLLYQLLSDQTPFDQKKLVRSGLEKMRRTIRECEPPLPSAKLGGLSPEGLAEIAENRRLSPPRLLAELGADLDWIVIKALDKDRARRYQSADGFADDIARYLNHEPIIARPPSRFYRVGKLVRRNKLVFVAAGIAAFGLLSGFGISTWMFFRERAARLEQAQLRGEAEGLHREAEYRALIAQAAVQIKYGDMAAADALLAQVPIDQTSSSLEAAEDFQAVASWHLQAGRINEAGARFSSMARALSSVDLADASHVSASLLPAAAVVAYTGEIQLYNEFRRMAIQRFGATSNPAVARQMIKSCLLIPANAETIQALEQPARIVEQGFESPTSGDDSLWAYLSLSLMCYRTGEYAEAARWVRECMASPNEVEVLTATMLIVRSMIERQVGLPELARESLEEGRAPVREKFADKSWRQVESDSYWFDWIIADLLLKEADRSRASRLEESSLDRALVLFYRGEIGAAAALLEQMPDLLPIPANAAVFREMGDWHVSNGRWDEAKAQFKMLAQVNALGNADSTMDDIRTAALLVEQGHLEAYELFRRSMINRYVGTEDSTIAQRVVRTCLLAPADKELLGSLDPFVEVIEQSYQDNKSVSGWQAYAMALMKYRAGDYTASLYWVEQADPKGNQFPKRDLSVRLIQSLALCKLGRWDEARVELEIVRSSKEEVLLVGPQPSAGRWQGYWFDRAFVRIHLREVEALMRAESE